MVTPTKRKLSPLSDAVIGMNVSVPNLENGTTGMASANNLALAVSYLRRRDTSSDSLVRERSDTHALKAISEALNRVKASSKTDPNLYTHKQNSYVCDLGDHSAQRSKERGLPRLVIRRLRNPDSFPSDLYSALVDTYYSAKDNGIHIAAIAKVPEDKPKYILSLYAGEPILNLLCSERPCAAFNSPDVFANEKNLCDYLLESTGELQKIFLSHAKAHRLETFSSLPDSLKKLRARYKNIEKQSAKQSDATSSRGHSLFAMLIANFLNREPGPFNKELDLICEALVNDEQKPFIDPSPRNLVCSRLAENNLPTFIDYDRWQYADSIQHTNAHIIFFPWNALSYADMSFLEQSNALEGSLMYLISMVGRSFYHSNISLPTLTTEPIERQLHNSYVQSLYQIVKEPVCKKKYPEISALISDTDLLKHETSLV